MEAVVKNLSSTVELLAVARHNDTVAQWDEETLSRALQWATYCEHIHNRFHHNFAIRRVLERQLELSNESLSLVFQHYTALSFSDLSHCHNLLLDGLLHNTHTPVSVLKILFDDPTHLSQYPSSNKEVSGICGFIIERKSACKVLESLNLPSASSPDTEVQAEMLLEKLDAVLKQSSSDGCVAKQFLDPVLQRCEGIEDHLCVVIGAALQNESRMDQKGKFILDWLEGHRSFLELLCYSLPLSLLADLAESYLQFRDIYCDVLKKWAKEMEYDIHNREWIPVSKNPSFQKLTQHFLFLFKTSISLRDHLEPELKALKFTDGDFDVRGLSIWGDLLTEILKNFTCS